ncbi:PrsW family glutamic-type intramembrane protease [Nonomuraea sp. NPDC052116]|uniref:PrsW family glutamic-type intramembrane protease n=1 Tax=Nonomuraea sp. NPDC052116 TaxID=3155665 RepID=UPI0034475F81
MVALGTGLYRCGMLAALLELAWTRGVAAWSGEAVREVVGTASYTVDPFIEEVVKVIPLAVAAWVVRRRLRWGLTDHLLLGAALGAGFALLEALLRLSHLAGRAIPVVGGWVISRSAAAYVPDVGRR